MMMLQWTPQKQKRKIKLKIKIIDIYKNKVNDFNIVDDIFKIVPRKDVIARVIRWQLSKKRSGNHKVKSRSEIRSTNAKIYRQKGTGKARHGPSSVVQFRGGGVVHGPVVRSHNHKLPKKIRSLGLKSALSLKAGSGSLMVLENKKLDLKTKKTSSSFEKLKINNLLIVLGDKDNQSDFLKSTQNIPRVDLIRQIGLNVYDLMKKDNILFTEQAINELQKRL